MGVQSKFNYFRSNSDERMNLLFKIVAAVALAALLYSFVRDCDPNGSSHTETTTRDPGVARVDEHRRVKAQLQAEIDSLDGRIQQLKAQRLQQTERAKQQHEKPLELSVSPWEYITDSAYYLTEAYQVSITPHMYTAPFAERRFELKSLLSEGKSLANSLATLQHVTQALNYLYGFVRFDPMGGVDADLHFGVAGGDVHSLRASRPFRAPAIVDTVTKRNSDHLVHMVMPLTGRLDKLRFFLDTFVTVYTQDKNLFLSVVYFGTDDLAAAQTIAHEKLSSLGKAKPVHRFLRKAGAFSRGGGLQHGAYSTERWPAHLKQSAAVLFFIDVDILFDSGAVSRCRSLPERASRVYYPVVFSQYNPDIAFRHLDEMPKLSARTDHNYTSGFWRSFGFGMVCLHYSDFKASGGFDLSIKGWGAEDVQLYRKFVAQSKITVMRAVDRGLFHIFHKKVCDKSLNADQMRMCQGTKGVSEASPEQMAYLLYQ